LAARKIWLKTFAKAEKKKLTRCAQTEFLFLGFRSGFLYANFMNAAEIGKELTLFAPLRFAKIENISAFKKDSPPVHIRSLLPNK
jgi:hypothetical protein